MVIKPWVLFARNFLQTEQSKTSSQGKQLTVYVANDRIQVFKQKLEFWKTTNPPP